MAAEIFEIQPDLRLQFGLHATSIGKKFFELEKLDPRITIVWEDAGVMPFSYEPVIDERPDHYPSDFKSTVQYSKDIGALPNQREFGMVAKGWITLKWFAEFEHHKSFILGERSGEYIKKRLLERQPRWDNINSQWMTNYPHAQEYYRQMISACKKPFHVVALIEDGMFEEKIQISAALFSEILWDPFQDASEIMRFSVSRCV